MGSGLSTVGEYLTLQECQTLAGVKFDSKLFSAYADKETGLVPKSVFTRLSLVENDILIFFPSETSDKALKLSSRLKLQTLQVVSSSEYDESVARKSQLLVLCITENSKLYFPDILSSFDDRVIPIIFDEVMKDNSAWSTSETLSPLSTYTSIDFTDDQQLESVIDSLMDKIQQLITPLCDWQIQKNEPDKSTNIKQTIELPPTRTYSGKNKKLRGHEREISSIVTAATGEIYSGSDDNRIVQWKKDGKKGVEYNGHTDIVSCIAILSPDLLLSGSFDNTVKLWGISTGRCIRTMTGHTDAIRCCVKWSGNIAITGGQDKTVRIWNIAEEKLVHSLTGADGYILCMMKLNDDLLVTGEASGKIRFYDVNSCSLTLELVGHDNSWITGVCVTARQELVSVSEDASIVLWSGDPTSGYTKNKIITTTSGILSVLALPDGNIVTGCSDTDVKLWGESNGWEEPIQVLSGHEGGVSCLALLVSGEIVSGSHDEAVIVWL